MMKDCKNFSDYQIILKKQKEIAEEIQKRIISEIQKITISSVKPVAENIVIVSVKNLENSWAPETYLVEHQQKYLIKLFMTCEADLFKIKDAMKKCVCTGKLKIVEENRDIILHHEFVDQLNRLGEEIFKEEWGKD